MTSPLADVLGTVLGLRRSTPGRVNLRRGGSPNTDHYAYPYLARLWDTHGTHFKVPILRFAALAATADDVEDDPTVPLGTFLRRIALADAGGASGQAADRAIDRTGRRLVWAQTGDVDKLHLTLRQLVPRHRGTRPAVSWANVADTYLWWDQPNATRRRDHRRRLLDRYYRPTTDPNATDPNAPDPNAPDPADTDPTTATPATS